MPARVVDFVGYEEVAVVGKKDAPPQLNPSVGRADFRVVASGTREECLDKGVVAVADGLQHGQDPARRPIAINQHYVVIAAFVDLVVVVKIDIPRVQGQHLAAGVEHKAGPVGVFV